MDLGRSETLISCADYHLVGAALSRLAPSDRVFSIYCIFSIRVRKVCGYILGAFSNFL